ncbi:MAG: glutamine--tRNA ligase/YqeY domain fusion protein [Thiotrichales bacterium]
MDQSKPSNFIRNIIETDLAAGKVSEVVTRFPPEPNGFLHIGHAKSIVLNFGIALDYRGRCNLRFDDTNPAKEEEAFVEAIKKDVQWLGYEWDSLRFASDYFEQLYGYAVELIEKGLAYVCELNAEETREFRGTLKEPGKNSPYRDCSVEENLELFARMRSGAFEDGSKVLRAKIDMASPNMNLRDPVLYRIRRGLIHHQTGDAWCLYPMYDYTHPISDAIEGVTHSLCTLEFEDHRPLYDWVLDNISIGCHPQQIEFSRLNLQYTVTSKRKLTQLVTEELVDGWDDPRMPTIAGLRRRGYTPASLREFSRRIGVTKSENSVEMEMLESCIREELDSSAARRMVVLRPLKLTLTNYPEGRVEQLSAANHPKDESMGQREIPFTREIYIDREDFIEVAPNKKWKRLVAGGEVRLRYGYVVRCDDVIKDEAGNIIELTGSYDPDTLGKNPEGRKVKGVIHWVSATHGQPAVVRLYDRLFTHPAPDTDKQVEDWKEHLNPASLVTCPGAYAEPSLGLDDASRRYQFEREGYFWPDTTSSAEALVFNEIVGLRDSWGKAVNT